MLWKHPLRDKPHDERGVRYVRERFFKGSVFRNLAHLRDEVARWYRDCVGWRIRGTARRRHIEVIGKGERQALAPWDGELFETTDWRTAKVNPDHHVSCQYALYSVPSTLCLPGQQAEIGLGRKLVRIFNRGGLLKLHPRQPRSGRSTDPADYPEELTAYILWAQRGIKRSAAEQGRRWPSSPTASSTDPCLGLGSDRATSSAVGAALYPATPRRRTPNRALEVDLIDVRRMERILVQALEHDEMAQYHSTLPSGRFARDGADFAHAIDYGLQSTQGRQRLPSMPNWRRFLVQSNNRLSMRRTFNLLQARWRPNAEFQC